LGPWSQEISYNIIMSNDIDDDTLPDDWETRYGLDPTISSGEDGPDGDPDMDGMTNLEEWEADTDPMDPDSLLMITGILPELGGVRISWQGGTAAWQYLEYRMDLTSTDELLKTIFSNEPTTTVNTNIIDMGATNQVLYYRIKADRP
jgi:hypothetical protein